MQQKQQSVAVTIVMGITLGLVILAGFFVGWQFLNRRTSSSLNASALDIMPEDVKQTALTTISKIIEADDPRGNFADRTVKNVKLAPNPAVLEHDEAWCFEIESVSDRGTTSMILYIAMYQGKWTTLGTGTERMKRAGC